MSYKIDKVGEFDRLQVSFDGNTLRYRSYWEGKAEGYNFKMTRQGDVFKVVGDNTSYPVPGSMVLWLIANGYHDWDDAKDAPETPEEVSIPADKMESAVRSMAEEEMAGLDLPADENPTASKDMSIVANELRKIASELKKYEATDPEENIPGHGIKAKN